MIDIDLPVDLFEKTRLYTWGDPTSHGECSSCGRVKPLVGTRKKSCQSCSTLTRCYDGKQARFQSAFVFVNERQAIIWMNAPLDKNKAPLVFAPDVSVRHPSEGRSFVQDALTFIMEEQSRQTPYLFINFYNKKNVVAADLVLNIDPDVVFVSGNRDRPETSWSVFQNVFDTKIVDRYSNLDFGTSSRKDIARLIEMGYTPEDMASSEWRAAKAIKTGTPKKWF